MSEDQRQEFWRKKMDEAADFMDQIKTMPVEDNLESMVDMRYAADEAGLEVSFSDTKIGGIFDHIYFYREGLIEDYLKVAKACLDRGWILKVEDAYRSPEMQRALGRNPAIFNTVLKRVLWENGGQVPAADFMFRRVSALIATCAKVGTHISGSAMDISILDAKTKEEIDRGGPYIELSELTPMDSPFISPEAADNRRKITEMFREIGFVEYPFEFWHYSKGDAYDRKLNQDPTPAKYGPVHLDMETGKVQPVEDPLAPLHDDEVIMNMITEGLKG